MDTTEDKNRLSETAEAIIASFLLPNTFGVLCEDEMAERATVAIVDCIAGTCECCDGEEEITSCRPCAADDMRSFVEFVIEGSPLVHSQLHGWEHWVSVYRNAVMVAHEAKLLHPLIGGKTQPVEFDYVACALLFALFHDCRRTNEGYDVVHGAHGSFALLSSLSCGAPLMLSPEVAVAAYACSCHTVVDHPREDDALKNLADCCGMLSGDAVDVVRNAVGMCLDADRIDLLRLGMKPMPRYLTHVDACDRVIKILLSNNAI